MSRPFRFDVGEVGRLYRNGMEPRQIHRKLGCSLSTAQRLIKLACAAQGIPYRGVIGQPSSLNAEAVRAMRSAGMTQGQIARKIGVSQNSISTLERRTRESTPDTAIDERRREAGAEPLPAGHPLAWEAISAEAWG